MAKAKEAPRPIIVKKVIEEAHGGHHGGAWKVAYADFVTAMMAFFLLMWLLGATTEKQRKALADYFTPTLVQTKQDSAGSNGLLGGDSIIHEDNYPHRAAQTGSRSITIPRDASGGAKEAAGEAAQKASFEKLKRALAQKVMTDKKLKQFEKNIRFTDTTEGLRIDMVDESDFSMFIFGTSQLTADARELMSAVADVVNRLPNEIIVRGHTDAARYRPGTVSNNWQLSASRAEMTRRFLAIRGVDGKRFARIEGVADTEPYIPGDPFDARNRRMSITLAKIKVDKAE